MSGRLLGWNLEPKASLGTPLLVSPPASPSRRLDLGCTVFHFTAYSAFLVGAVDASLNTIHKSSQPTCIEAFV